jgi:hypothetical protein
MIPFITALAAFIAGAVIYVTLAVSGIPPIF